jgi:hypothetical protein
MKLLRSARALALLAGLAATAAPAAAAEAVRVLATVDAGTRLQGIDGFGVNVTPAQWRGGALRPVLDRIVDELGASLVRLDCYGTADWLDPAQAGPDGRWPEAYLEKVYTSRAFTECWETFRHLAAKGAAVHLNVSGRAPAAWTAADGRTLTNFDAYAEMVVSLARWARQREKLPFTVLAPFNETDLGPPEGPAIPAGDIARAVKAVVRRLDAAGLADVNLVLMCDASPNPTSRYAELLADAALVGRIAAFSGHTYGDGDEQDASADWFDRERPTAAFVKAVRASAHPPRAAVWLTEYGDLDQTGAIEWQFAWRSTRRLLKALEDGWSAALAWDAFDNQHLHDAAWTEYGLLKVDRASWTYTPRKRWFAASQVYRFVRPGWSRVEVSRSKPDPKDVYGTWHDAGRHVRLLAFASPDGADATVVGMNRVESDVQLELTVSGLAPAAATKPFAVVTTTRGENARRTEPVRAETGVLKLTVPEGAIFTITTLDRLR